MRLESRHGLILSLVAATALASCGGKKQAEAPPLRPVRFQQVFSTGSERTRTFSGVSRAGLESRLSFKVVGTVNQVAVQVGDHVRKGQVLMRLDPRDYEIKVQEAEAAVQQAEADARNAASNYERVRALYENKNASRTDLDGARARNETAQAGLEAARKRLELARLQLSYTRLIAPVDGAIASIDVEVNENVSSGMTVAMLTAGAALEVEVAIPEVLIARIRRDDPVTVRFDALADQPLAATVSEVGVASTGLATTFPVTVRLSAPHADARPGMAAEVEFRLSATDDRDRILVPPAAIAEDAQGRYAYVVEPGASDTGTVRRRTVTVGELTGEGLEVLDGLADRDLVVTAGVSRLHDGQQVRLPGTDATAP